MYGCCDQPTYAGAAYAPATYGHHGGTRGQEFPLVVVLFLLLIIIGCGGCFYKGK